ncbi:ADP-ribosylglycohydrolase family protein [Teredinibacter sp. KSP-S5-2]|uniref:ADP-ribosylglycohydrolase family protein n=1 Tax=Teredinibacter sp. KSP-S5-2 TaxID=3034506 RepID=UPI002934DBE6|nr:ADP-ribosylglycohydrolase family protein [Teredinibacter sp. KSP-S5-2]WNO10865.1 ADP-ribosylglycohydrolase family protein [Teredinibacter sp. KSP-S5-2]
MLLYLAIGDAYGAGFEFASEEKVKNHNNLKMYYEHGLGIKAGNYTDDTQMSLALAELLIEGEDWIRENIAHKFVECFKRDQRLGYSEGFYQLLCSIKNGSELLNKINPYSTRNGAAMRATPIGYIKDIPLLLSHSAIQAAITHDTEIGIKSAQAVALICHYFIYNLGPKEQLLDFVKEYSEFKWSDQWSGPVACCGKQTVNAILTVLSTQNSLAGVLRESVEFCGDVDTVAAVALAAASRSQFFVNDLPSHLIDSLENEEFGLDYLKKSSRLLEEYYLSL